MSTSDIHKAEDALFFSIIVPACNIAPFAEQLIRSLKEQTDRAFEAIIVNEESSDNSIDVLRRTVGDDKRFQIVTLKRSGSASVSRNYGIDHASGKYLVFVDGDDWIEPDSLERFRNVLTVNPETDVLFAGFRTWNMDGSCTSEKSTVFNGILTGCEALTLAHQNKTYRSATWSRVYRRDFLLEYHLYQMPGRHHQDDEWTPRVLYFAKKTVAVDFCYYNYRKRENSITTKRGKESLNSTVLNLQSFFLFFQTHAIPPDLRQPLAHWYCGFFQNFFAPFAIRLFAREDRRTAFLSALSGNLSRFLHVAMAGRMSDRFFALFAIVPLWAIRGIGFRAGEFLFRKIYYRNMPNTSKTKTSD